MESDDYLCVTFASVLLIAQFGFKKLLIKQILGKEIQLPEHVWKT